MEDIRKRIRAAVLLGSTRRIAKESGVSPNTIYGFIDEENPTTPHGDTVAKLARWLDIAGAGGPEQLKRIESFLTRARRVLRELELLTEEQVQLVFDLETEANGIRRGIESQATQPVSRATLDAAGQRQLEADAAAARGRRDTG
jgi:hypothetical protein